MNELEQKTFENLETTNKLLLKMVDNQKQNFNKMVKNYTRIILGLIALLISMVVGFFIYESQFEIVDTVTTEETVTYEQEVSGENSNINNVEGNQYNDNATHNE